MWHVSVISRPTPSKPPSPLPKGKLPRHWKGASAATTVRRRNGVRPHNQQHSGHERTPDQPSGRSSEPPRRLGERMSDAVRLVDVRHRARLCQGGAEYRRFHSRSAIARGLPSAAQGELSQVQGLGQCSSGHSEIAELWSVRKTEKRSQGINVTHPGGWELRFDGWHRAPTFSIARLPNEAGGSSGSVEGRNA